MILKNLIMKRYWLLFPLVFTLGSCVFSLYPISNLESAYVFRKELSGNWVETNNDFSCAVDTIADKKYLITLIDDMDYYPGADENVRRIDTSYFEAFLIQLSGQYYLDCSPAVKHKSLDVMGENAKAALLPLHRIYKVDLPSNDRLVISGINTDSLEKYLSTSAATIKKEVRDDDYILLTDPPETLQKNLLQTKTRDLFFPTV